MSKENKVFSLKEMRKDRYVKGALNEQRYGIKNKQELSSDERDELLEKLIKENKGEK